MSKKLTLEYVIQKFKLVHGDFYDYSKFKYEDAKTKGIIICPKHGEFEQSYNTHSKGVRCPKCAKENIIRCGFKITKENFLERAERIHGDKYEYNLSNFNNNKSKIKIKCLIHGWFEQSVSNHLIGQGCPICGNIEKRNKSSLDKDNFIQCAIQVHGNKFDYSNVEYINNKTKVCIICPIHGEFWQTPNAHLNGNGCAKCIGRNRSLEDFINEARKVHGDNYDYSLSNYITSEIKIKIKCNKCGHIFKQKPWSHLQNHGCPKCKFSKGELEIEKLLTNNNIIFECQKRFNWLGKQSLDFYIPSIKTAIEVQGHQHFDGSRCFGNTNNFKKIIERDKCKSDLCKKNNINLIYYTNLNIDVENYLGILFKDKIKLLNYLINKY